MAFSPSRAWVLGLALGALTLGSTTPLAAQQPSPKAASAAGAAPAPADPELTAFAKAYVAVGLVRDDYDAQLAQFKNKTVELQTQLREEYKKKVGEAIQAAGLSADAYRRIEFSITTDPARRAAFDQILAAAEANAG